MSAERFALLVSATTGDPCECVLGGTDDSRFVGYGPTPWDAMLAAQAKIEALHCLKAARATAIGHRDECAAELAECQKNAATHETEIVRMDTRIEEIDAAIKQLGGKQER